MKNGNDINIEGEKMRIVYIFSLSALACVAARSLIDLVAYEFLIYVCCNEVKKL